ncbi:hypothetical protein PG987_002565 [Apiospora arundinis]
MVPGIVPIAVVEGGTVVVVAPALGAATKAIIVVVIVILVASPRAVAISIYTTVIASAKVICCCCGWSSKAVVLSIPSTIALDRTIADTPSSEVTRLGLRTIVLTRIALQAAEEAVDRLALVVGSADATGVLLSGIGRLVSAAAAVALVALAAATGAAADLDLAVGTVAAEASGLAEDLDLAEQARNHGTKGC